MELGAGSGTDQCVTPLRFTSCSHQPRLPSINTSTCAKHLWCRETEVQCWIQLLRALVLVHVAERLQFANGQTMSAGAAPGGTSTTARGGSLVQRLAPWNQAPTLQYVQVACGILL